MKGDKIFIRLKTVLFFLGCEQYYNYIFWLVCVLVGLVSLYDPLNSKVCLFEIFPLLFDPRDIINSYLLT